MVSSLIVSTVKALRGAVSGLLLIYSVSIIILGLYYDSNIAKFGGVVPEIILFLFALLLLAANESFQVGLLGTQHRTSADISLEGFPRAAKVHTLIFPGPCNKLKNLLIGQSFLVVLCSFTIAQLTTFATFDHENLPWPLRLILPEDSFIFYVMVESGLPGVVTTVICAQLLPSMLAKEYPLHCLNIPGMHSTIRLALLIEHIGIVKLVYTVTAMLDKLMFATESQQQKLSELESEEDVIPVLDCRSPRPPALSDDKLKRSRRDEALHRDMEQPPSPTTSASPVGVFSGTRSRILPLPAPRPAIYSPCESEEHDGSDSWTADASLCPLSQGTYTVMKDRVQLAFSVLLTSACFGFASFCTCRGYSIMSTFMSVPVQVICLATALVLVFYCEGLKIAVVSNAHLPPHHPLLREVGAPATSACVPFSRKCCRDYDYDEGDDIEDGDALFSAASYTRAERVHSLLCPACTKTMDSSELSCEQSQEDHTNEPTRDNVKRFLLGRQMIVVPLGFLVAQLTHYSGFPTDVPWMPPFLYFVVITVGVPGVLILLQFAQLTPQLLAEGKSVRFMNLVGCYSIAYSALCIESCGITDAAWVLYKCVEVITKPALTATKAGVDIQKQLNTTSCP